MWLRRNAHILKVDQGSLSMGVRFRDVKCFIILMTKMEGGPVMSGLDPRSQKHLFAVSYLNHTSFTGDLFG